MFIPRNTPLRQTQSTSCGYLQLIIAGCRTLRIKLNRKFQNEYFIILKKQYSVDCHKPPQILLEMYLAQTPSPARGSFHAEIIARPPYVKLPKR